MKDIEFNLIDEPWLKVIREDLTVETLSLKNLLLHAQDYKDLAGETPAQNFAVLRMLLALLYTIFERVDVDGTPDALIEIDDIDAAYDAVFNRWQTLWELKHFPEKPILDYFNQHHDAFWLFHPARPFYQVPEATLGSPYNAPKLIGDLSESGNKKRLFSSRSGIGKEQIPFAEAARWLLYINAFDDTSAKPKKKGLPSPGAGWVGKLGMVENVGNNLFETLLLNLTFLKDGTELWSAPPLPAWEHPPKPDERPEISIPDEPAALLSLQSRRILLKRKDNAVVGYTLLGGDFFSNDDAFNEQMTSWRKINKTKKQFVWHPKRMDPNRQMWRDFGQYFLVHSRSSAESNHLPGIIQWLYALKKENIITPHKKIQLRGIALQYGDKDFFINDFSSDTLTYFTDLLNTESDGLRNQIETEIQKCDDTANAIHLLCRNIAIASGSDSENEKNQQKGRRLFYQTIDQPMRAWLLQFNHEVSPENNQALFDQWENESRRIAAAIAEQLEANAGPAAFRGHTIHDQKTEKDYHYTVSKADLQFRKSLNKIYPRKDVNHEQTTTS